MIRASVRLSIARAVVAVAQIVAVSAWAQTPLAPSGEKCSSAGLQQCARDLTQLLKTTPLSPALDLDKDKALAELVQVIEKHFDCTPNNIDYCVYRLVDDLALLDADKALGALGKKDLAAFNADIGKRLDGETKDNQQYLDLVNLLGRIVDAILQQGGSQTLSGDAATNLGAIADLIDKAAPAKAAPPTSPGAPQPINPSATGAPAAPRQTATVPPPTPGAAQPPPGAGIDPKSLDLDGKYFTPLKALVEKSSLLDADIAELANLRKEIYLAANCSEQRDNNIQPKCPVAIIASANQTITSKLGASQSLASSQARRVNAAIEPLLKRQLGDLATLTSFLNDRFTQLLKDNAKPSGPLKASLQAISAKIRPAITAPAKPPAPAINVYGAFFGDVGQIRFAARHRRLRAGLNGWRFCSATRAIRTICQTKSACFEQQSSATATLDGTKDSIDPTKLCGFDPVPYAEPMTKGLVIYYECLQGTADQWWQSGWDDDHPRRMTPSRQRSAMSHAVLRAGQIAEIRCSGAPTTNPPDKSAGSAN